MFHGRHQRVVEKRFASFGTGATAVPISKTGKNALDFHLSFYMGYIASRNPDSKVVVVANDKGYEPMLEHARAMGFVVRRQPHGEVKAPAKKAAAKKVLAKPAAAKQPAAKKVVAKAVPAKQLAPAKKSAPAQKVAAKAPAPAAKGASVVAPVVAKEVAAKSAVLVPDSAATLNKLTDSLRKMGDKRPTRPASLWRSLKSFLGVGATEAAAEVALARLNEAGVVKVDSVKCASYRIFDAAAGSTASQV